MAIANLGRRDNEYTAPQQVGPSAAAIDRVLSEGDLSGLNPQERVAYYNRVCESLGLNPLTKPFEYLKLNGKLILYARRDATDQLRRLHAVSITIVSRERLDGIYLVTARATTPDGRCDESIGAVPIEGLKGENLSNALMKAEAKAKRRVTLSICGLGMTDDSEVDSIPKAERVPVRAVEAAPKAKTLAAKPVEPVSDANEEPDAFADDVLAGWLTEVEACTTHEELAEVMLAIAKAYKQGDPAREMLRPVCAKKQAELAAANKGAT